MLNRLVNLNEFLVKAFDDQVSRLERHRAARLMTRDRVETMLAVALAITTMYFAHYFFQARPSPPALFQEDAFRAQYYRGIYAYRILGREILLFLNRQLFGGANLYAARALLNGVSLLAFNLVFLQLLRRCGVSPLHRAESILVADAVTLMALSVNSNPYTIPSLALIYGAIYCAETDRPVGVLVLLVLGTLTHDFNVLILVYWVLQTAFGRYADRSQFVRRLRWTAALVAAWVITYAAIRWYVPGTAATIFYDGLTGPAANIRLRPLMVLAFILSLYGVFFTSDAVLKARQWPHVCAFVVVAVPYYVYLFFIAHVGELRLVLPFLPSLIMMSHIGQKQAPGSSS